MHTKVESYENRTLQYYSMRKVWIGLPNVQKACQRHILTGLVKGCKRLCKHYKA